MRLEALAKVNLSLEILRRRQDGFHDITTVMHTVDLVDELEFEPAPRILVEGDTEGIPTEDNLIYRAACALQSHLGSRHGALIKVRKRIPVAAGLGGGSSDAAAALVGLCRLWQQHIPLPTLMALAADLGSDVPFFLHGGAALAEGRGERITPIPPLQNTTVVLVAPKIEIPSKTATLYRSLNSSDFTDGTVTNSLAADLRKGLPPTPPSLFNGFTRVALESFVALQHYQNRFGRAGATNIHLSGTGPSLFSIPANRGDAKLLYERCLDAELPAFIVTATPNPYNLR